MTAMARFLISFFIVVFLWFPMVILSLPVVAIILKTEWSGTTTWFGNKLHGRGTTHYKGQTSGNYWKEWYWLCIRNPVSNFGKFVINTTDKTKWAWLEDKYLFNGWYLLFGWKNPDPRIENRRPFVFRPWKHD